MIIDGRGRLKLADFGIAATVTDTVSRISLGRHGLSGTACYMSPQQLDGQPPQVTDDIYSLGATLYELLTSRAPFFTGDIAHQVRSFAPQPLDKRLAQLNLHNPVPPAVNSMIMACLAKEPEKRPQSARAIAEQIGLGPLMAKGNKETPPASERASVAVPRVEPAEERATAAKRNATPPSERSANESATPSRQPEFAGRRNSRLLAVAALVVILAVAGGGWWWSIQRGAATSTSAAAAAPEFTPLFNGHDFTGWDGDPQVWSVQDGFITANNGTSKERRPVALFWRAGTVEDFELRLSFRIRSGNSGIYYRAKQLLGYEVGGYQFEISGPSTGLLIESGPDRIRRQPSQIGSVTILRMINGKEKLTTEGPSSSNGVDVKNAFRPGGWNDVVINVQNNHVVHTLNGHTMVDAIDEYEKRPRSGTIALEVYGTAPTSVQFRDIRLKRLKPQ
jgi:hypothetical protein